MEKTNFIHLKLDENEAIEFKKQLLIIEMGILRLTKKIRNYRKLRELELKNKMLMNREIKLVTQNIGRIDKINPDLENYKIKVPKIKEIDFGESSIKSKGKDNLEKELQNIQERLRILDEKF